MAQFLHTIANFAMPKKGIEASFGAVAALVRNLDGSTAEPNQSAGVLVVVSTATTCCSSLEEAISEVALLRGGQAAPRRTG